ncbi:MAG: serine hydrolase [Saprospiraceae bacterium]|jgi:CubicO group peptidase (beta-lactamase class C family)|nr:serine hydrolase [Saprospiraceae bacterium]MBP6446926.1 serine hydrolase [Saprospiraceae bacterium]
MIPYRYVLSFILFFFIKLFPSNAQEYKDEIKMGTTIYGEIGPGQKHKYLLKLKKELNFSPGEEFVYCITGFTLLAEAVARVSGMTFAQFTQKNIFGPLQMKSTLFYDDHEKIVKNRA